jgi:hypothetical protein
MLLVEILTETYNVKLLDSLINLWRTRLECAGHSSVYVARFKFFGRCQKPKL